MGQNNRIEKLEAQIEILKSQLEEAQSHTYIYNTDTIWCRDGELYIGYNDDKTLVMDVDQLFRDLPSIIRMVTKEQKKMQAMHHKMIKEAI
ncbi:hypothetical protein [uncultured Wocania sp.]|uniref:hypothetical protein n=1 Tax=uncultured Wocania sp. TaxID=2834404 RepID=UPI0030FB7C57